MGYSLWGHKQFDAIAYEHLNCKENSNDQLYSSDHRTQYLIISCQEKESEKDCLWITESLCCTPETGVSIN